MSLIKANSAQIGQSATATQNFTLAVPASPDGTVKLARGNSGATTQDVLTVDSSGNVNAPVGLQQGGVATGRMVLGTAVATTSGTAIDFTGIPSWVKKITVIFNQVALSGSNHLLVEIGSGAIATSGYISTSCDTSTSSNISAGVTSAQGFACYLGVNTSTAFGTMAITNITGNTWIADHSVGKTTASAGGGGVIVLGGVLDRLRLTNFTGVTLAGNTFAGGSVNILYEG